LVKDSANDAARNVVALTYFNIGEISAHLADCTEARKAYQRSLDLYLALGAKGIIPKEHADKPNLISRKIAMCDEAIERAR
jgi:hypothetical protein